MLGAVGIAAPRQHCTGTTTNFNRFSDGWFCKQATIAPAGSLHIAMGGTVCRNTDRLGTSVHRNSATTRQAGDTFTSTPFRSCSNEKPFNHHRHQSNTTSLSTSLHGNHARRPPAGSSCSSKIQLHGAAGTVGSAGVHKPQHRVSIRNRRLAYQREGSDLTHTTVATDDSSSNASPPMAEEQIPAWKKRLAMRQLPPPVPPTTTTHTANAGAMNLGGNSHKNRNNGSSHVAEMPTDSHAIDTQEDRKNGWRPPQFQKSSGSSTAETRTSADFISKRFQRRSEEDAEATMINKDSGMFLSDMFPYRPTSTAPRKALKGTKGTNLDEFSAESTSDNCDTIQETQNTTTSQSLSEGSSHTTRGRRSSSQREESSRSASKERPSRSSPVKEPSQRSASKERPSRSSSVAQSSTPISSKERPSRSTTVAQPSTRSASKERPSRSSPVKGRSLRSASKERPSRSTTVAQPSSRSASKERPNRSASKERPNRSASKERPSRCTTIEATNKERPSRSASKGRPSRSSTVEPPSTPTASKERSSRDASKVRPSRSSIVEPPSTPIASKERSSRDASKVRPSRSSTVEQPSTPVASKERSSRDSSKVRPSRSASKEPCRRSASVERHSTRCANREPDNRGSPSKGHAGTCIKKPTYNIGSPMKTHQEASLVTSNNLLGSPDQNFATVRSPTNRTFISPGMHRKSQQARDRMAQASASRKACVLDSLGALTSCGSDNEEGRIVSPPVEVKKSKDGRTQLVLDLSDVPPAFRHYLMTKK